MLVTYYFNGHSSSQWTDPANLNDGSLATFAKVFNDNYTHNHNSNTCPGTVLGTISKVEIRVYGYMDIANGDIRLVPVFSGGDGDTHDASLGTSPEWSTYFDITTDTNAPSPWTWAAVQGLDGKAIYKTSESDWKYAAKVEIRVTFSTKVITGTPEPIRGIQLNRTHHLSRSPIGLWPFNAGTGKVISDLSGNSQMGTLQANAHFDSGKFGFLIDFDGTDDWVSIATKRDIGNGPYTVIARVQTGADVTATRLIMGKRDTASSYPFQLQLREYVAGHAKLSNSRWDGVDAESTDDTVDAVANTDYWVACTWDGADLKLFVDGILKNTVDASALADASNPDVYAIGARQMAASRLYWDGKIYYVYLYNRALSVSELAKVYRRPSCMFERATSPGMLFVEEGEVKEITGTVTSESVVTGTIDISKKVTGTVTSQSTVTGSIKVLSKIVGTVDAQSVTSGTISGIWLVTGTITCESSVTGNLVIPAGGFSDYAENNLLEHIAGKTPFSKPTVYIGFCIADPGEEATGAVCNEVANTNGYGRIPTSVDDWNEASSGAIDNANKITSPCASGSWGKITHFVLVDSPTYGEGYVLTYDELDAPVTIDADDIIEFPPAALSLTLD